MTYTQENPKSWHNRFSKNELQWSDLSRNGKTFIPIIAFLFISTISILLMIAQRLPQDTYEETTFQVILKLISLLASTLTPILFFIISIRTLNQQAVQFIKSFYSLSDEYDLQTLIRRKLFGVPPLPFPLNKLFRYPFITIKEANDLPKDHWSRWFGGPATLVIYDGVAIYVERGNKFSRVLGPGLPMPILERYETIKSVVDLRPQIREENIKTWTKDGIEVILKVRAEIQIESSEHAKRNSVVFKGGEGKTNLVYPYDPEQVKMIVERTAVRLDSTTNKLSESTWDSAAMGTITGNMKAHIASYTINDLMLDDEHSPQIGSFYISDTLANSINKGLEIAGSNLISLQVTNFKPVDKEIEDELIKYWDAQKQKFDTIRKGETEAEKTRLTEFSRAYSQENLLDNIVENLGKLNQDSEIVDSSRLTEASLLFLTQALEQKNSDDPIINAYLVREILNAFDKLQEHLDT